MGSSTLDGSVRGHHTCCATCLTRGQTHRWQCDYLSHLRGEDVGRSLYALDDDDAKSDHPSQAEVVCVLLITHDMTQLISTLGFHEVTYESTGKTIRCMRRLHFGAQHEGCAQERTGCAERDTGGVHAFAHPCT
eukprot:1147155-Pelagomonas_calceolata.AAC.1